MILHTSLAPVSRRVLYKGLRVRMGVHLGTPKVVRDPMTRRVEYIGPVVNAAARITAMTHGGQIVMSHAAHHKLLASAGPDALSLGARVVSLGKFELPDVPNGMHPRHGATSRSSSSL
jgi:class 3 adenylate cyclase